MDNPTQNSAGNTESAVVKFRGTPGPWTIEPYGDDETPNLVIHRGETENRICFMATPGSHGDPAMIEADAKLIAAAPDMLAALKTAIGHIEHMASYLGSLGTRYSFESLGEDLPGIRAALAAAVGDREGIAAGSERA